MINQNKKPIQSLATKGVKVGVNPTAYSGFSIKNLMNQPLIKGAQVGMKTYSPMAIPELEGTEDVIDPQTMALYRMGRGY